ncbi:selenium metabolism protein YedF [Syntrophus gentianae]|uniref:Selenium metabolism protein YedF n=1 Tax=Syntrophus gentianae TaxID=43775 RepID=A0A1H7YUD7_9BACT|nr:sulfurtransferase-like selenium metabolism protein YedF [Syntrophus gentianae]SEM49832.1 selenium metabolism protein YedF [Syntrophus gentianae]
MEEFIDARGLACPQPVILTKKALEQQDELRVRVDNIAAVENVKRLAKSQGCQVTVQEEKDRTWTLSLIREEGVEASPDSPEIVCDVAVQTEGEPLVSGPCVILITSNAMGQGDDELGRLLFRGFFHTLQELDKLPDKIIFYNSGVKLTVKDSDVLEDIKQLAQAGVEILVCGTCVNFFNLTDQIAVGTISNMYDIAGSMRSAGLLIRP